MTERSSANSVPSALSARHPSRWVVVLPVISLTLLVLGGALQSWSYWRGVKSLETQALAWGGGFLGLVLLAITSVALIRENRHRRETEIRLQQAAAELERRVADRTATLHDREQRLQAIVNTAVEGIITIDHRGIVDSMNPAAERMFGYRASEVIGQKLSLLMPEPYRSEHGGYVARYLATGQAKIIGIGREVVGRRKDGAVFPIHLSVSEI